MSPITNNPFTASPDSTSKIVTGAVFALLLVVAVTVHNVITGSLVAFLLVAAYAWSPTGYEISDGAVVVRRLAGNVRIRLDGIREVRVATADDFRGCIRLFASGGLFGYYGIFRTSKLGKSTWYVTNRSRSVVIVSDSGTAVLSPDDVGGFVAAASSLTGEAKPGAVQPPGAGMFPSIESDAGGGNGLGWIKAAILMAIAGTVAASMLYAPGPPAYTLTKESLAIHDRFYPVTVNAASVDIGKVRVIDFDRDPDWQPVARTNGFGTAHYHSGWFRVSSGKVVRMYRADSTRVVLLPPKGNGTPVLFETKEPERFVAEVEREWGSGS